MPHLPCARRRGVASSRWKTRWRLVPCGKMRRRLVASFPRGKTKRRLVPALGDARYRPIAGGPRTSIPSDRYDFSHFQSLKGHEHRVMALLVSDDGNKPFCISGDSGGGIFVWSIGPSLGQEPWKKWYEHNDWRYSGIHCLAVSGTGYLYSGSGDKSIKAWSMQRYCRLGLFLSRYHPKSIVNSRFRSSAADYGRYQPREGERRRGRRKTWIALRPRYPSPAGDFFACTGIRNVSAHGEKE
ncbi:hypothetical protein BHE74_00058259 [Ensete ventricosum]|nr:hypothetical protein BHE74_00058259 [Ensete ventricosum]